MTLLVSDTQSVRLISDTHTCNMTSAGSAFSGGYYGSRLLKPVPVPPTHTETDFLCWYSFRGVTGQRLVFQLRQLSVGHFDTTQQRSVIQNGDIHFLPTSILQDCLNRDRPNADRLIVNWNTGNSKLKYNLWVIYRPTFLFLVL